MTSVRPLPNSGALNFLRAGARLVTDHGSGRAIASAMVVFPSVIFVLKASQQPVSTSVVVVYLVLALPAALFAFLAHEVGHWAVLQWLGVHSRLEFTFPLDLRMVPLEGGPTRSTSPALLLRGLAGSTANIMLLLVLLAVALIFESPAAAYLAIWQGFSALAVTPWSADRPETDASTLRNALALEDKVELQVMREGPERVVKLALTLTQRWKTCIPYWVLIGGLKDPSVSAEGEKVAVFALDHELALVVFPDTRDGTLYLMASGLGAPGEVNCLTRCGSRAYLADDGRESREAGRRAPSC